MFAVEALGSYISRGVTTVSSPFHPFGGAVDIVVVEQQDGSFKSSPWYVRFGKFQGVLKAKEKVVNISVDGVEADFHMYLDSAGVAYFLREVDKEEMSAILWPSSSSLQTDSDRMSIKSKSCNYDAGQSNSFTETDVSTGKLVARTRSDGSQTLGIVFESQSMKPDRVKTEEDCGAVRIDSLDVQLSTKNEKDNATNFLDGEEKKDLQMKDNVLNNLENPGLQEDSGLHEHKIGNSSESSFEKLERSTEATGVEMCCSTKETSPSCRSGFEGNNELKDSEISRKVDENGADRLSDASQTSIILSDGFSENTKETDTLVAKEPLSVHGILGDESCCNSFSDSKILESENVSLDTKSIVTETYSGMVAVHLVNVSAKEGDSCSAFTISRNKSIGVGQDELKTREEKSDSQAVPSEFSVIEEIEISQPEPEEEQFLFSDLDDFKPREFKCLESISLDQKEKENGVESANESFCSNIESDSSPDKFVWDNLQNDGEEELRQGQKSKSSNIDIPKSSKVSTQEVGFMTESLPTVLSDFDDLDAQDLQSLLTQSLDSNSKPSKWLLVRKDVASCIKSARDEEHRSSKSHPTTDDAKISVELENVTASPAVGDPSKISNASSGSWRLWPFSLSSSKKVAEPDSKKVAELDPKNVAESGPMKVAESCPTDINADNALESISGRNAEKDVPNEKILKHTIRGESPTSEQLASLNLKEGRNTVTFTFLTSMLGEQQVDATIYLWRWDAHIVISDVDGTITKSDILGQFMPLVGKDWSHTGVVHLFSAIKENGYQMLYLSARSISQAYLTRRFLFNLKQDGIALPDGPVVISPDGLFPSLFREVIRRAPHEFKIACLEDIKALFPSDRNPFYAGFGNRDTDEISYLKVGIPKGKIFIVNPKGEVMVNRSVDTKSYTSLKALVNRMFPPPSSFEPEDFNSWNFWKPPPPAINI